MTQTKYPGDWRYSPAKMKLRQETLTILLKNFGEGKHPNRKIYECAEEWVGKQSTTSGLVSYFKAYYNK